MGPSEPLQWGWGFHPREQVDLFEGIGLQETAKQGDAKHQRQEGDRQRYQERHAPQS